MTLKSLSIKKGSPVEKEALFFIIFLASDLVAPIEAVVIVPVISAVSETEIKLARLRDLNDLFPFVTNSSHRVVINAVPSSLAITCMQPNLVCPSLCQQTMISDLHFVTDAFWNRRYSKRWMKVEHFHP